MLVHSKIIWASSWDYGTYHIGDQRRLWQACTSMQSCQSLRCSHTWSMEVDEGSHQKSDIYPHWMAAHAHLNNKFTEDEKCHNLTRWLIYSGWILFAWDCRNLCVGSIHIWKLLCNIQAQGSANLMLLLFVWFCLYLWEMASQLLMLAYVCDHLFTLLLHLKSKTSCCC